MDNVQDWNLICHVFQGTLKFGWLDLAVFMYKKYTLNTELFKGICVGDIVTAGHIDVLEWIPVEIYKSYYTGRLRWVMIPHICSSGNPEVYKLLTKKLDVKQEEIIRMPTNEKYNIIKYAVKNEHYQMVDYLENTGIFNVTNMILPLLVDFCYEEEWYVVDAIVNRYDCMEYFINNRVSVNLSQKKYDYGKASKIFRILVNKYGCKLHHNNHSIILSLARKCQPDDMIDIMNMFVAEIKKSVTATSDQK